MKLKKINPDLILILALSLTFCFLILFNLPFELKAQNLNSFESCNQSSCLTKPTDAVISNDGSFFLVVDSTRNPSVRKFNISSGVVTDSIVISLSDNNLNEFPFKIGLSQDNRKAFIYRTAKESEAQEETLLNQVDQSNPCFCPAQTYFNEVLCVNGTLDCTNSTQDIVCGCDGRNYLNSCSARASGIKKFTKESCGFSSSLNCTADDQCPSGSCPNGRRFKKFTCTQSMCTLIEFSADPCSSSSSSSSGNTSIDCKCSSGSFFDGTQCITGTLDCTEDAFDTVCGCDGLNYLNICSAMASGIKKFTKDQCGSVSNFSCTADDQCPLGTCTNGSNFKKFTCNSTNMCTNIEFSIDPCLSSSSGGTTDTDVNRFSIVHVIDLTNNSVKTFTPILTDETTSSNDDEDNRQNLTTLAFFDPEGEKLIGSNNDEEFPKLLIINTGTGEIEDDFELPDIANSLAISPNFEKVVITFKDLFSLSTSIYNIETNDIKRLDLPSKLLFKIDDIVATNSFDFSGDKTVLSTNNGRHVTAFLNLKDQKLALRFLSKNLEGNSISRISKDGSIAVVASNIEGQLTGHKIYTINLLQRSIPIIKSAAFLDNSTVLDVKITPDQNKILVLTLKGNNTTLKTLNLNDLSLINELVIANNLSNIFTIENKGTFGLAINPNQEKPVSIITDFTEAPVLENITPKIGSINGGTLFTIDGFIDLLKFTKDLKVCFNTEKTCAESVNISGDGKTITGITPKINSKGLKTIFLIGTPKPKECNDTTISCKTCESTPLVCLQGQVLTPVSCCECPKCVYNTTKYKKLFRFIEAQ